MNRSLFIFGCGYSGRFLARTALAAGWRVAGTTRSAEKADALAAEGIEALVFDGASPTDALLERLATTTHLVQSIAPEHGMKAGDQPARDSAVVDPVLRVVGAGIVDMMPRLSWVGYWSTIGVYGDHGGAWIDEEAELRPSSRRAEMRVAAEAEWMAIAKDSGLPVSLLRLGGIYGPGRNAFVNLAEGRARRIVKAGQVFNRIHVDDIAAATLHFAERRTGGVFNLTDGEPAPPQDVIAYAASLMNVEPPPEIAFEEAGMTPMARSFYGDNKRVSNLRMKEAGYAFGHVGYRESLGRMWNEDRWR